jgi:transposase-like protein
MSIKVKCSPEEKADIVEKYLSQEYGPKKIFEQYGIKKQTLYGWVRKYRGNEVGSLRQPITKEYSPELKIKIVKEYLDQEHGPKKIFEQHGVAKPTLYDWVTRFKVNGEAGLAPAEVPREYSPETKMKAVIEYLNGSDSLRAICVKYNISNTIILRDWIKWYNKHGAFMQPKNGGAKHMDKGKARDTTLEERLDIISFLVANNIDYEKAIKEYNVSYNQIYSWYKKFKKDGPDGLVDRRGKRKDENSMNEVEKLRAQIKIKEAENLRLQIENDLLKKLGEIERRRGRS